MSSPDSAGGVYLYGNPSTCQVFCEYAQNYGNTIYLLEIFNWINQLQLRMVPSNNLENKQIATQKI